MAGKKNNCPHCGGSGKRISGRVMLPGTHRTYGYGERVYKCRECNAEYSIFYPIPPKYGVLPPKKDEPDDGLLRPGWRESIKGHAYNIVVGSDVPGDDPAVGRAEPAESEEQPA